MNSYLDIIFIIYVIYFVIQIESIMMAKKKKIQLTFFEGINNQLCLYLKII